MVVQGEPDDRFMLGAEFLRGIDGHIGRGHADGAILRHYEFAERLHIGFAQGGELEEDIPALVPRHCPPRWGGGAGGLYSAVDIIGTRQPDRAGVRAVVVAFGGRDDAVARGVAGIEDAIGPIRNAGGVR